MKMLLGVLVLLCMPAVAVAGNARWLAVSDARLDQLRGGFDRGDGVVASFGLLRTVSVDGAITTVQDVHIPDLATITSAQAQSLGQAATVVQNAQDNRQIATTTTLDIGVNSLGNFDARQFQAGLQDALIRAR
jgi:hypothetical protein